MLGFRHPFNLLVRLVQLDFRETPGSLLVSANKAALAQNSYCDHFANGFSEKIENCVQESRLKPARSATFAHLSATIKLRSQWTRPAGIDSFVACLSGTGYMTAAQCRKMLRHE